MRILLLLEDYGELMFLQTVLKKIGFDVEGIQNSRSLSDHVLSLNPDVLVMTAFGKRVRGFEIAQQMKRNRGIPEIILIRTPGSPPLDSQEIAAWLGSPVSAPMLLDAIADLGGLDKQTLQDKFKKLRMQEAAEKGRELKGDESISVMDKSGSESENFAPEQVSVPTLGPSSISSQERQERYKKFLTGETPPSHGFAVKQVQEQVRDLRRNEAEQDDLERQRRAFVEELFKKGE